MADIVSISGTLELADGAEADVASPAVTVGDAFRTALDALMRARGHKGVDVTKATGLSSATITKLKNGERGASFEVLEKLRAFFGVTPAALFDPDAALAQMGLARREPDTVPSKSAHAELALGVNPLYPAGAPLDVGGGTTEGDWALALHRHPDAELLSALLAYWDAMTPDQRLALVGQGRRLRHQAAESPTVGFKTG